MDKGRILAISCSILIFLILLSFIFYSHSDFDQQLISQVDEGVPAEKLIPQIDKETAELKLKAKKRLESIVMDKKFWGNGTFTPQSDYVDYTENYQKEMELINNYDTTRKAYAKREISKEEFLENITIFKEYFKIYQ
ncbi:MAG: hypothetical protein ABFC91_00925 [Methanobacteriaceae archaeon]